MAAVDQPLPPEYNDALSRFERTKARKAGEPNPWIVGKGEVQKYLTVV